MPFRQRPLRASLRPPPIPVPIIIGLAALALVASVAHASDFDEPEVDDVPVDGLSSTVRAVRPGADGATTTRVDTDDFRGELRHAADLVAASPGATVLDFGGLLATSTVSLRGASPDQVKVAFDGVLLNASAGGGSDLSLVPAALLDAVEVRRGSEGATLGAGAMGGSVLLTPAKRDRALLTGGLFGTFGASASKSLTWSGNDGLWSLLVAADARRTAGNFDYGRDPTPEIPDNDPIENLRRANNDALLGSALVRASHRSPGRTFTTFLLAGGGDRGLPGPIYSPTRDSRQRTFDGIAAARLEQRLAPARSGFAPMGLDVPLNLRLGRLDTRASGLGESDGAQHTAELSLEPTFEIPLGSGERGDWALRIRGAAGAEWFEGVEHGERTRIRGAAGLELARETGRWTASTATRFEQWGDASAFLARAGGSLRLNPHVVLFASGGNGFRPPSFGELYFSAGPVLPNPDLLPERSLSADTGARFAFGPVRAGATLFGGLYENVIVYELFPGFRAKPLNVGSSRVLGAEVDAKVAFESGPLRGLKGSLAYTELRTTNLVEGHNTFGRDLPYRPRRRVVARADYTQRIWRTSLEMQAVSSAFSNRANTRSVEGFPDLRAGAGLSVAPSLWLSAELRNALDVRDRMTIDGYPLPGRLLLVHLSWEPGLER